MTSAFGRARAAAYDTLYGDKDYEGECDLFGQLFARFGGAVVRRVLDLGCGTGGHAVPLARRGYAVVGVDSSPEMLAGARAKAASLDNADGPAFVEGDIRSLDLGRTFDAALMSYAVLGYQHSNLDVLSALRVARRHLNVGGLLIFDIWYGPAILHDRPANRVLARSKGEKTALQSETATLDTSRHVCTVDCRLWRIEQGVLVSETTETHIMRYFFPLELQLLLECSAFSLVQLSAFPQIDAPADDRSRNALVVARAVGDL
jgi:SAM-dependent methyltransferase